MIGAHMHPRFALPIATCVLTTQLGAQIGRQLEGHAAAMKRAQAFVNEGAAGVRGLVEMLRSEDPQFQIQAAAVDALGRMGPIAAPACKALLDLLAQLVDANNGVRIGP
jgi:HEAT repeat protein